MTHLLAKCSLVVYLLSSVSLLRALECSVEGEVRLIGGRNSFEGRLEVCLFNTVQNNNIWGTVCNDAWGQEETDVVCRQLGVARENFDQTIFGIYFGGDRRSDNTPIHWWNTTCNGDETHLVNCSNTPIDATDPFCVPSEDIGLVCKQLNPECRNGDVRILDVNGKNSTEGRVEFCRGGQWGTVCSTSPTNWDNRDATVVCNQLGMQPNVPRPVPSELTQNAQPHVPIVLDGVGCTGMESRLGDCDFIYSYVEGCSHDNDIGVNCTITVECEDGEVQLVGGTDLSEGRVDYCQNNLWGAICRQSWDDRDAEVVCRQLGYVGLSTAEIITFPFNGEHFERIYIERAECIGNETRLSECPTNPGRCLDYGAGVHCYNESNCNPLREVRLRHGTLSDEIGTVDFCYGDWGFVCDNLWDDNDAEVVCRQLGLTGGIAIPSNLFGLNTFDRPDRGRFILDDVKCTGNESTLAECTHQGFGTHDCKHYAKEYAAVSCGYTRGSQMDRCTGEQLNKSISTRETSLQVGSFGVCEQYSGQSSICNAVISLSDYVFLNKTQGSQTRLSASLDHLLSDDSLRTDENNSECVNMTRNLLCHYFFAPCGSNGAVHVPRGVCSDECTYVQNTCRTEWDRVVFALPLVNASINCTKTDLYLTPFPACCVSVGIQVPETTTSVTSSESISTSEPSTTDDPVSETSSNSTTTSEPLVTDEPVSLLGVIVGGIIVLFLLLLIIIALITFCVITARRRKATIRSLQMDILSSPTTKDSQATPILLNGNELDSPVDVKMRVRGSISKGPLAVPNPYTTKQELEIHAPLLSPHDSNMMNRISSSIIRELTSNMLIPYTRLKLMDCVGQGEFGVVYKAHYTEPEGDVGYKTSTVAVKTLKGFFEHNQVNKIMEESIKMKHFDHPNVLNLVGVCLDAGPAPYVVMPYMANGSLLHYLKKERHNLVLSVGTDEDVRFEVCKRLVVMCVQISSGMEYLAHEKFVHRDLAARNCMIDIHFVIKIADFGLSEDVYAKSYFRQSGSDKATKLPVKWMAPESLTDGIFSEKSDVWSFGITCWEIFSGGKTPYPGVDPMALSHMLESEKRLGKPLNSACPEEIYQVMKHCWEQQPEKRPTFEELVGTVSSYAEKIAGYLDISSYNPFTATYEEIQNSKDEDKIVSSPEQLLKHIEKKDISSKSKSPKGSRKTTPKASPRASPKPSPKGSPRRTPNVSPWPSPSHSPHSSPAFLEIDSTPVPSAGIEIRITDSPTEKGSFLH